MDTADRERDQEAARRKKTFYLMAAGAAALILPLVAVAYLHLKGATRRGGAGFGFGIFEKRQGGSAVAPVRSAPAMAVQKSLTAPAPDSAAAAPGGSLGYIRGGSDYQYSPESGPPVKKAQEPLPAPPRAPVASPPPRTPAPRKASYPKLRTRGSRPAAPDMQEAMKGMPRGAAGAPDMRQLMQNIPAPPDSSR